MTTTLPVSLFFFSCLFGSFRIAATVPSSSVRIGTEDGYGEAMQGHALMIARNVRRLRKDEGWHGHGQCHSGPVAVALVEGSGML